MDLTNVVALSKGRYVIHNLDDLKTVAQFATPGVCVLCLANSKRYIMTNVNQWAELSSSGSSSGGGSSSSTINNQIVNELPSIGDSNTIYLVPSDNPEEQNTYIEYMYINNNWEQIGSANIDFSAISQSFIDSLFDDEQDYPYTFESNIVDALPQTGLANVIYLVPLADAEEGNIYEEWIYINNTWEKIGTTEKVIDAVPFNRIEDLLE